MILYIVTDTAEAFRQGWWHGHKVALEEIAGDVCLVLHYRQVSLDVLADLRPWAVCHSGGSADYDTYDVLQTVDYLRVIREWPGAQIGFCGGHQILAYAFGGTVGRMGKLRPGEPDYYPQYHPGYFKERGVYPIRIVQDDPLFAGFRRTMRMLESHRDEVKELAPELLLLASTPRCRVQAFVHRDKPLYGVQFHPEQAPEGYPDGRRLLENFFCIARAREEALR